jgi:hypothetical protein
MIRLGAPIGWLIATILFAIIPRVAPCQSVPPPPRLETSPSPAPVDTPFHAILYMFANPSSLAFYGDTPTVAGSVITVHFDSGCGFLCPGETAYASFPLDMPALAKGLYTVRVVDAVFPTYVYAELPLAVGIASSSIPLPASSPWAINLLILIIALCALRAAHRRARD